MSIESNSSNLHFKRPEFCKKSIQMVPTYDQFDQPNYQGYIYKVNHFKSNRGSLSEANILPTLKVLLHSLLRHLQIIHTSFKRDNVHHRSPKGCKTDSHQSKRLEEKLVVSLVSIANLACTCIELVLFTPQTLTAHSFAAL